MKRLLLAGGGQAHVFVLRALARERPANVEVILVTPSDQLIYTGMLPGWIAGHYRLPELTIPLAPLLQAANTRLVLARIAAVDVARRTAHTDRGEAIDFDLLSIATGPTPNFGAIAGAHEYALPLRPLDAFVAGWQRIHAHALAAHEPSARPPEGGLAPAWRDGAQRQGCTNTPLQLTIIGAGAGGIEIALAAKHRLPAVHVRLVTGDTAILPGHNVHARSLAHAALRRYGVQLVAAVAERVESHTIVLDSGESLASDHTLLMTGAAAEPWLRQTGLATDDDGFVAINEYLQSRSHDFVFAAGDAATMMHSVRPKSGVYAVRAGAPLAVNLLAALSGTPLKPYRPQRRALYLLSTGARHAIASWGSFAFEGDWVWRWKDRIDRGYIAKFSYPFGA
ncbi:MAG TPA: FAD-dependent oxidoreductase [Burkholderiaceae bacterium]|nr:FAD-dependent oxidoreductase [Burkholderiaceae bacterium]